jgi:hypothetical protein
MKKIIEHLAMNWEIYAMAFAVGAVFALAI